MHATGEELKGGDKRMKICKKGLEKQNCRNSKQSDGRKKIQPGNLGGERGQFH